MAMTNARAMEAVIRLRQIINAHKALLKSTHEFLETNSDLAIDWANASLPTFLTEDGSGNLTGTTFTRGDVANAIGSLIQTRNLMTNAAVSQGDHLGNLNKIADVYAQ